MTIDDDRDAGRPAERLSRRHRASSGLQAHGVERRRGRRLVLVRLRHPASAVGRW